MQKLSVCKSLKFVIWEKVNSLPKDKYLNRTKLKAFEDDKLDVAKITITLFGRVENTMRMGENAGY